MYPRWICTVTTIWLLLAFSCLEVVRCKYVEGHLITNENWAFLARFCFLSDDGVFEYKIEYDKEYAVQNLLLYYDSNRQWPAVYKTNKTCVQKEAVLSISSNQVVNLTEARIDSGCVLNVIQTTTPLPASTTSAPAPKTNETLRRARKRASSPRSTTLTCHNVRKFKSARERWWYIAVSNCDGQKGLNIKYQFTMTNGVFGDYWHEHFSADEFYILPVLLFFSLAYLFLLIGIVMCTVELRSRQLLHATYKLFVNSVLLQELGIFLQGIAYVRYASDGVGFPKTKQLGRLMEAASETCFLLLLLLLAKGYTVTRGRLRVGTSIRLTIFMCVYVVTYITLFIYEREFFDPGEVLYLYESPAGYGLMVLRIVAWWMFVYSTVFTLKHYPEKATFYYPFNLLATLWFVSGPCFIMSANSLIDKWVRESVVYAVLHSIAFLGHIQFMILTRPSKANKNFPFHVRTSQIAAMENAGVGGAPQLYRFQHHAYAPGGATLPPTSPSADWITEVPVELFSIHRPVRFNMVPSAPPATMVPPLSMPRTPPTAENSTAMTRAMILGVGLGQDMAGGDARVGDGQESPPGHPDEDHDPDNTPSKKPRSEPKDPQMFIAPSQRGLASGGSSGRPASVTRSTSSQEKAETPPLKPETGLKTELDDVSETEERPNGIAPY